LERLDAYFDHLRQHQVQHFRVYVRVPGCPFASLGSELCTQDEAIRRMAQQISERKCRYLESTLADAMELGEIPRQDAKSLAQEVHFFIAGLIQEAKIFNNIDVLERMKTGVYRIIGAAFASVS